MLGFTIGCPSVSFNDAFAYFGFLLLARLSSQAAYERIIGTRAPDPLQLPSGSQVTEKDALDGRQSRISRSAEASRFRENGGGTET